MKSILRGLLIGAIATFVFVAIGCSGKPMGSDSSTSGNSGGGASLLGSGATFPKPLYEKWVNEYEKVDPNVKIDYQAKGSGGGQKDIIAGIVDFGASDDPMKDEDMKNAKGEIIHFPTTIGAVALTYNVAGLSKPLNLTSEIISGIYLGEIKKWNDPKIKAENADANLPDTDISPVYRADSSGTTAVFTDYLSKTNPTFADKITSSKQPNWVTGVGIGAKGNDGVLGQIKQTPNTIGYVEVAFALENNVPVALIKNKAGKYVDPSIANISAAAGGSVAKMPDDLRANITNADGETSYPISSYTYMLVYKDQKDPVKGKALVDFLWWAIHDGETFTEPLHYAPLPPEVVKKVEGKINSITAGGMQLHKDSNTQGK